MSTEALSAQEVWQRCLEVLQHNFGSNTAPIRTFLGAVQPIQLQGGVLTLRVPSQFFYEYIEEHFSAIIVRTLRRLLGPKARLEYHVMTAAEAAPMRLPSQELPPPTVFPGIRSTQTFPTNLNPKYTFENFIEGECNRIARSAGMTVAQRPGQTAFNPLFIYGEVGQGKTHLAHAIGNYARLLHPDKAILYLTSERFTQEYTEAARSKKFSEFLQKLHSVDLLIVDDIQFLIGKQSTQDMFFHVFNHLHQKSRQIVITADAPPSELRGMEERIISRFSWGLAAPLMPPDYETRLAILRFKLQQEGIQIPEEILAYIAENVQSHVRDLEGVVIQLLAETSIRRRELTLSLAQEIVSRFKPLRTRAITVDAILKAVSNYFKIHIDELTGKSRRKEVAYARHIAVFLARKHTRNALKALGEYFGGRDHSTILHSYQWVSEMLPISQDLSRHVQDLERILFRTT
ncbi:MAG: chromosomal replication initiator protein DnaA [Bacteroidia bacterium]|nr:chromosomal replication initiator protein DnaA [Bacteroidia bacterium]MCX7764791.1 chromosomal replication initiator protein DnaA [Bacteroidia bacterium]MDW8058001.1 chromosomal replication initiator protein DnaA [Bacteroidia bacterium]